MENNTNQLNSMMCKKNCGFFGNAACDGYCSKCYKDHVKRQNSGTANGRVTPTTGLNNNSSNSSGSSSSSLATIQSQSMSNEFPSALAAVNNTTTVSNTQLASIGEQMTVTAEATTTTTAMAASSSEFAVPMMSPSSSSNTTSNSSSSSSSSNNNTTNTPVLSTHISSSIPIPIPSSKHSSNEAAASAAAIDMGMSVPTDLLATSPLDGVACSVDESGTSMGTSMGSEKKKRSRCVLESCKRKVGLTGFDCRCGGLYCWEHRYSDKHNCKFDYKELGQDQIRKNNPIVVGEKIQKI